ncbi:hypothetical protein DV737_g3103, partial [Chaetothyriales sp. CBS 132003]
MPRDSRSHSPYRHGDHRPHKRSRYEHNDDKRPLPFSASQLSKHDLDKYRPLFALYLDLQKRLDIEDLEAGESVTRSLKEEKKKLPLVSMQGVLVTIAHAGRRSRRLVAIEPSVDELKARREEAADDARSAQEQQRDALRVDRRVEKKVQKERLDDLVPRAEPGSRERHLEKKREANMSNRAFAQSAHEAGDVELKDSDVMGGDTLSELKQMKQHEERKKNERELRREEMLRARRAEREERGRLLREKEDKTMEYLRGLARERFG